MPIFSSAVRKTLPAATSTPAPVAAPVAGRAWAPTDLNYQQLQTALGSNAKDFAPIYDYVNQNITNPLYQTLAAKAIGNKTKSLTADYLKNPGYLSQVNQYLKNNTQDFMGNNLFIEGDKRYALGDKGRVDFTNQYNTYKDYKNIDPNHYALAEKVFDRNDMIKGNDGKLYSKYGLIVGGLGANKDFVYDKAASLASKSGNDAIYRSLTNPNFTVDDYQMGTSDFRTADWSNVFSKNANLKSHLGTLGSAPGANASDAEWLDFLHTQMNSAYDIDTSPQTLRSKMISGPPVIEEGGGGGGGDDNYSYDENSIYPGGFNFGIKKAAPKPTPVLTPSQLGKSQYDKLVEQYKGYGAYDPIKNISSRQFWDNSHSGNWDPILSPTDPILIDKGQGQYETWGRFSKYIPGDFDSKLKTWTNYSDANSKADWEAKGVPDYVKLGKSAEGHVKQFSGLSPDVQNAIWLKDNNMGTGFAFNEAGKTDYGYAPSTGMLKMKSPNAFKQFIGPVLSVASMFFPVLAPVAAAVNIGLGASSGNWMQAIGGVMGMPGLGTAMGMSGSTIGASMASGLSSGLGVSSQVGGALLGAGMGGLGAVANGGNFLQGALGGGLGSYAGGLAGNFAGGGVNPATNQLYNPVIGSAVGGLTSSAVSQLVGRGQIDPTRAVINGLGGGLNAAIKY